MDGRQVLSRIRELADTPVIMLTARDDSSEVVLHLEEGADEISMKPFRPPELAARVQGCCAGQARRVAKCRPDRGSER